MKIHQVVAEILRPQGYKGAQTDGQTDESKDIQTKNIMPLATTYGGGRHNKGKICLAFEF